MSYLADLARFRKNDDLLIELEYDPSRINEWNESGYTAIMWACRWGDLELTRILIEYGADINAHNLYNGNTPLIEASEGGFLEVVKLLVASGAHLDAVNKDGRTAMSRASWLDEQAVARYLFKCGASSEIVDKDGRKAFINL